MLGLRLLKCEEFDDAGSSTGGTTGSDDNSSDFDMASAVEKVGTGLGFTEEGVKESNEPITPIKPVLPTEPSTTTTDKTTPIDPAVSSTII